MKKGKFKKILGTTALGLCALAMPLAVTACDKDVDLNVRFQDNYFQWQFEGDTEWNNLITIDEIKEKLGEGYQGIPGTNGKEVEFQTTDTHIQWRYKTEANSDTWKNLVELTEIKGDEGEDGSTPFIGDNGNWWIGSADTGVKAEGQDGEEGRGVVNVSTKYKYDSVMCEEYLEITINYTDNTSEIVKVAVPKKVAKIEYVGSTYLLKNNKESATGLQIKVIYDDDSIRYVDVTDDMFVGIEKDHRHCDSIDFSEAGVYKFKIYYAGKTCFVEKIQIVDSLADIPTQEEPMCPNLLMLIKDGNIDRNFHQTDVVNYKFIIDDENSQYREVSLLDENIAITYNEEVVSGQEVNATVYFYNQYFTTINIMPIIAEEFEPTYAEIVQSDNNLICEKGQTLDTSNLYIRYKYYDSYTNKTYTYKTPVTADMIASFDNNTEGLQTLTLDSTKTFGYQLSTNIVVYDKDNLTVSNIDYSCYRYDGESYVAMTTDVKLGEITKLSDLYIRLRCKTPTGTYFDMYEPLTTEIAPEADIDFSKIGTYDIGDVEYKGVNEKMGSITIYDPDICNIQYITSVENWATTGYWEFVVDEDYGIEDDLLRYVIGQEYNVKYYDNLKMTGPEKIVISRDMIDLSHVDLTNFADNQYLTISYGLPGQEKYTRKIQVQLVPDMTNANLIKTYVNNSQGMFSYYNSVSIYDNNIVKFSSGGSHEVYLYYDEESFENNILSMYYSSAQCQLLLTINGDNVEDVEVTGEVKETYTYQLNVQDYLYDAEIQIYGDSTYTGQGKYYAVLTLKFNNNIFASVVIEVEVDKANNTIKSGYSIYIIKENNILELVNN